MELKEERNVELISHRRRPSSYRSFVEDSNGGNTKPNETIHPRKKASLLSKLFFWWITPLMKQGFKRVITAEDLHQVLPEDESESLGRKLEMEWEKEQKTNNPRASLANSIVRVFGMKYVLISMILLLETFVFRILQPILLGQLIQYFEKENTVEEETAYMLGLGIVLCSVSFMITENIYTFESTHIGIQMRIACCSLIFRKCLKLSQSSLSEKTTVGQMVNLMSNDVKRFESASYYLSFLLISPLQFIIATITLYYFIGPSSLAGLALVLLFIPIQGFTGKVFSKIRDQTAKRTDERIRSMNELTTGIRVIKLYAWEIPFSKLIETCRRNEMKFIQYSAYFNALVDALQQTSFRFQTFASICLYVWLGNTLSPEKVFVTIALFSSIRDGMGWNFIHSISTLAESLVSIQRIQDFLMLDEYTPLKNNESSSISQESVDKCFITCKETDVGWQSSKHLSIPQNDEITLENVSFTVETGQMLAIIGQVGSGKSLLLNMILGEIKPIKGITKVQGRLAYAPQEPWIYSGTVRQNILCGLVFNVTRYSQVVQAAALDSDLSKFPLGDETQVGEKGISLSGGQKARIGLARCLYVDADIYLLDDPLSAVDAHVGRHIFDNAINGFLKGKIRILATHQLQYLQNVDQVLVLERGTVRGLGTYDELEQKGVTLLNSIAQNMNTKNSLYLNLEDESFESKKPFFKNPMSPNEANLKIEESFGNEITKSCWKYFSLAGGFTLTSLFVLNCIIQQSFQHGSSYWLSIWTNAEMMRHSNVTSMEKKWDINIEIGTYVYSGIIGGAFIFAGLSTAQFYIMCTVSSIKLHYKMFNAVLRSPMSFFDKNPVGRILNRFSKDTGCMDDELPKTLYNVVQISFEMLGIFVVTSMVNILFLVPVLIFLLISCSLRQIYLRTSLSLRRIEAASRSPVFSLVSDTILGLTTLRAHQCQDVYQKMFDERQNSNSSAYYLFFASGRWLSAGLNCALTFYLACVIFTCIALRGTINGSEAGLVLSTLFMATLVHFLALQSAETENNLISVERIMEYGQLQPEAALESTEAEKPPLNWPQSGTISFENVNLKYDQSSQFVLKDISFTIKAKEKIGIVGKTGAGKSSLITALFRLTESEGKIVIDGTDIKTIGLHDLRSKISIIPQDPFLFSGTLRKNLDPFDDYNDDNLWMALEAVKLKDSMKDLSFGLEFIITGGGSNLSVGQRQLVCLARAILRQNKILVMDEATANVDHETDMLIQQTIREKFKNCTVLTIAHRLNTIIDADRVMIIDSGCRMEFDEPNILMGNPHGMFYRLAEKAGLLEQF